MSLIQEWFQNVFALDLRSLSLFRILVSLFIIWDIYWRLELSIHWYTSSDEDPYAISHISDTPHKAYVHELLFFRKSLLVQQIMFSIQAFCAALLCIGYKSQFMTFVNWILWAMLHGRQEAINDSSDRVGRNLLLLACFVPLGEYWSIDARRKLSTSPRTISNFGTAGIILQILFLYHGVLAQRWRVGPEWFPSGGGSAMHYIMSGSIHTTSFAHLFSLYPSLMYVMTLATMVIELVLPLALLFTSSTAGIGRIVIAAGFVALHTGVRLTMVLTNYTLMNLITAVVILPSCIYDPQPLLPPSTSVYDNDVVEDVTSTRKQESTSSELRRRRGYKNEKMQEETQISKPTASLCNYASYKESRIGRIIPAFLVLYMTFQVLAVDFDLIRSVDEGNIGQAIRFSQDWRMFRSTYRNGWFLTIKGTFEDKQYDVLRGITNNDWKVLSHRVRWQEIPSVSYARYPGWRYERWAYKLLGKSESVRRKQVGWMGKHLCRVWNDACNLNLLQCGNSSTLNFVMYIYDINGPSNLKSRYGPVRTSFEQTVHCDCLE